MTSDAPIGDAAAPYAPNAPPGTAAPFKFCGPVLQITLQKGETAWLRRSSLVLADGPFTLSTHRIAKRRFNAAAFFSGQVRWANRFDANGDLQLEAARDVIGEVVGIPVGAAPVHFMPGAYLGHVGDLTFNTRRVAKKEFWTLTQALGSGTVWIKVPGRARMRALPGGSRSAVVDANYVTAISGAFTAHGKVFKARDVVKSGELENVRLSGEGWMLQQSVNEEEMASGSGGGGILGGLLDLLPF